MRKICMAALLCLSINSYSQQTPVNHSIYYEQKVQKALMISATIGIIDKFRYDYSHYREGNSTFYNTVRGFFPVSIKTDYQLSNKFAIGLNVSFDKFYRDNYYTFDSSTNNPVYVKRIHEDNMTILSYGPELFYHFINKSHPRLDFFIGSGFYVHNIWENNIVKTSSGEEVTNNTIKNIELSPTLHAGVRYFVNSRLAVNTTVGYDKISIMSFGFTYRIYY